MKVFPNGTIYNNSQNNLSCSQHAPHQPPAACTIFAKLVLAKNETSKIIVFIYFEFELNIDLDIFI